MWENHGNSFVGGKIDSENKFLITKIDYRCEVFLPIRSLFEKMLKMLKPVLAFLQNSPDNATKCICDIKTVEKLADFARMPSRARNNLICLENFNRRRSGNNKNNSKALS